MISNLGGVAATGMAHVVDVSGTFGASAHPIAGPAAHRIAAARVGVTPRKRRAAAGTAAASVRGAH